MRVNALAADALPDPPPGGHEADDPDDTWLLALAEASGADWLVTGDRRSGLLPRGGASTGADCHRGGVLRTGALTDAAPLARRQSHRQGGVHGGPGIVAVRCVQVPACPTQGQCRLTRPLGRIVA
jgi:hypothetical protein